MIAAMTTATGLPPTGRVPADTLPHRLQLIRDEMGWSQRKAAQECGLGFGEWQSMENGAKARGLDDKIRRIADRTGYDPVWLMWGGPLSRPGDSRYAEVQPTRPERGTIKRSKRRRYPSQVPRMGQTHGLAA